MRTKCLKLYKTKKLKKLEREMVNKEMAYRIKKGQVPNKKKSIKTFKKLFMGICKINPSNTSFKI
jgi:hypothetical protein